MIVISKRQTFNLTRGKSYKIIEITPSRYKIISDRNRIITTSFNNFYDLDESRKLILNNILDEK
jgi:hypothetical protein